MSGVNSSKKSDKTAITAKSDKKSQEINGVQNLSLPVMVDSNYEEYNRLQNCYAKTHILVPVKSPRLNYTFPKEYIWTEVHSGVLLSVTFNSEIIKTGYLRIAPHTAKPFEKTSASQICMAVVEGLINAKSSNFEMNAKNEPVLTSVELSIGCHMCIPNNSMYTLENRTDEEASVYYCMIRN